MEDPNILRNKYHDTKKKERPKDSKNTKTIDLTGNNASQIIKEVMASPPNTDEAINDNEFIPITRLKAQAQIKTQTKTTLPRPILKKFRIEDSDNNNEKKTNGDEISKI